MRKGLIATAVAVALFAVGAFAASFAVDSEDIASGSNAVERCATEVEVDFNESFIEANNDWDIASVDLTITPNTPRSCDGFDVTLVLQDDADDTVWTGKKTGITGTSLNFTATDAVLPYSVLPGVGDVWHAAVLIDDFWFPIP